MIGHRHSQIISAIISVLSPQKQGFESPRERRISITELKIGAA
jgi:hypothetical protein